MKTSFPFVNYNLSHQLLKLAKEGQGECFRFEDSTQCLTNPRKMTRPVNQLVD